MTPGPRLARRATPTRPGALAKLEYCARTMEALRDVDARGHEHPDRLRHARDQATVQEFYESIDLGEAKIPRSLDGDLQIIFARRHPEPTNVSVAPRRCFACSLKRNRDFLAHSVYRWTGVDPTPRGSDRRALVAARGGAEGPVPAERARRDPGRPLGLLDRARDELPVHGQVRRRLSRHSFSPRSRAETTRPAEVRRGPGLFKESARRGHGHDAKPHCVPLPL